MTKSFSEKIEALNEDIERSIEVSKESEREYYANGEYHYLVEESSINTDEVEFSEELEEALEKSTISREELVGKIIGEGMFSMEYEEQSSPFQYGGKREGELDCLSLSGDREERITSSNLEYHDAKFSEMLNDSNIEFTDQKIKDLLESSGSISKEDFRNIISFNVGYLDHVDVIYDVLSGKGEVSVIYNNDYDIVRVMFDDNHEEEIINYLKENKKVVPMDKTIKMSMAQYLESRKHYDGFCYACGNLNEGSHEPDAEKYECEDCGELASYGIETAYIMGHVTLTDEDLDGEVA